jgi:hypothetical protein
MKLLLLLLLCTQFFIGFSQDDEGAVFDLSKKDEKKTQAGKFNFALYYGIPHIERSWRTSIFKSSAVDLPSISNIASNGFGPIGARGEYLLLDMLGLGFDIMYNRYSIKFDDNYQMYDPTFTNLIDFTDNYKYTMERLRVHLRFNFYFKLKDPLMKIYLGFGTGLNYRKVKFLKNGNVDNEITTLLINNSIVLPISNRVCFGFKQQLRPQLALNFEAGIGGPLFTTGLSFNF